MKTRLLLYAICLCLALAVPMSLCDEFPQAETQTSVGRSKEDALYSEGTRAINANRWADADAIFSKIARQHGSWADGAIYWQAYAENKEGKTALALETCGDLRRLYPQSKWVDECGALEIEIRSKTGDPMPPQAENDADLKLLALNSLMQQDQSHALPIVRQILNSGRSEALKSRALFVLAQNQSKEAQDLLAQIARGETAHALQAKAIQMFVMAHGKQSLEMLANVYRNSSDQAVKATVLRAYFMTRSPDPLVQAARHESNPQLARTAVQSLGAMGAMSQLLDLYREINSEQTKAEIIDAITISGRKGADALESIVASEQEPELRQRAIRNLGVAGGMSAARSLIDSYKKNSDVETKKAVLQALFLANDGHDLVELARTEKNPTLKQSIVRQLSVMHNKEATDYLLEILSK